MTHASGTKCHEFEAKYGDCMEAYGPHRGVKDCRVYFNDLMECQLMTKQVQSSGWLMWERWEGEGV